MDVIDSHTEGEPTRVVVDGWPTPVGSTMTERRDYMQSCQDHLRRGVVLEPRGHEAVVGALLTAPITNGAVAGVIFFNDVGYLGMCGHGMIGVIRTLWHLQRIAPGVMHVDTPVGAVQATLADDGLITIRNVPARLYQADVQVDVPGVGVVIGDVAWGGNWFFLTHVAAPSLDLQHRDELLRITMLIRTALRDAGISGSDGAVIDHVELFAAPRRADADSRNFVLCPGTAYDRSPCGTGTSAKMAVLHARGELAIGTQWRQESIVGSRFVGWLEREGELLVPHIQARAFITARATLLFDPQDPFRDGLH
jgi:4-hydroxyproline epimerase